MDLKGYPVLHSSFRPVGAIGRNCLKKKKMRNEERGEEGRGERKERKVEEK